MRIVFKEDSQTFHLYNDQISYIMTVLRDGQMGQLYFGKRIRDREDFSWLLESLPRPMSSCTFEDNKAFSLDHLKQEYPSYGTGDYRMPAVEVLQENGSRISRFVYRGHRILEGKPKLEGLPATYTEDNGEAQTLVLTLEDEVTHLVAELSYTLFAKGAVLARSVRFLNGGGEVLHLTTAMSLCLDLPDHNWDFVQFSGAWARERHLKVRRLEEGIQSVGSRRGHSSHEHNPFVILKRPGADEFQGEAVGLAFVYSGNFLAQAEVGSHGTTRVLMGIHPDSFDWKLEPGETFQTPEAVLALHGPGTHALSQTFRPPFPEKACQRILAGPGAPHPHQQLGGHLHGFRRGEDPRDRPQGKGVRRGALCAGRRVVRGALLRARGSGRLDGQPGPAAGRHRGAVPAHREMGMKFGLWFEPEMVNRDSDLFRAHPDWILHVPGRPSAHGRFQYVLDFSRKEVVDCIYGMMEKILSEAEISYIKWDMNRSITECYSPALPADRQGEVFHGISWASTTCTKG